MPEPKLEVTEHRQYGCTCARCGTENKGEFPSDVPARVQYGAGIRALAVLLNIGFKLPLKKIETLFADLFGYAVNQSTIVSATQKCYKGLELSEKVIKNRLLQSLVAHFDETGLRVYKANFTGYIPVAINSLPIFLSMPNAAKKPCWIMPL